MKKDTKEKKEKKIENKRNDNLYKINFVSIIELDDYRRIARGREFRKVGTRLIDIVDQEVDLFLYDLDKNLFRKMFKYKEVKRRKKLIKKSYYLEDRKTSNLRSLAYSYLREVDISLFDRKMILKTIREEILDQAKDYELKNKKKN